MKIRCTRYALSLLYCGTLHLVKQWTWTQAVGEWIHFGCCCCCFTWRENSGSIGQSTRCTHTTNVSCWWERRNKSKTMQWKDESQRSFITCRLALNRIKCSTHDQNEMQRIRWTTEWARNGKNNKIWQTILFFLAGLNSQSYNVRTRTSASKWRRVTEVAHITVFVVIITIFFFLRFVAESRKAFTSHYAHFKA